MTPHEHASRSGSKKLLSGALEAQRYKFSSADGCIKVAKDSMIILKGERTANLYKIKGSVIVGDDSQQQRTLQDFDTRVEVFKPYQQKSFTRYQILQTCPM